MTEVIATFEANSKCFEFEADSLDSSFTISEGYSLSLEGSDIVQTYTAKDLDSEFTAGSDIVFSFNADAITSSFVAYQGTWEVFDENFIDPAELAFMYP